MSLLRTLIFFDLPCCCRQRTNRRPNLCGLGRRLPGLEQEFKQREERGRRRRRRVFFLKKKRGRLSFIDKVVPSSCLFLLLLLLLDMQKEDSCNAPGDHLVAFAEYGKMRDALNATGRHIYFSLCGWNSWYAPQGKSLGNSWRIAGQSRKKPKAIEKYKERKGERRRSRNKNQEARVEAWSSNQQKFCAFPFFRTTIPRRLQRVAQCLQRHPHQRGACAVRWPGRLERPW